jgi:hypothetical protein
MALKLSLTLTFIVMVVTSSLLEPALLQPEFDILIKNGRIVDGSGRAGYAGRCRNQRFSSRTDRQTGERNSNANDRCDRYGSRIKDRGLLMRQIEPTIFR